MVSIQVVWVAIVVTGAVIVFGAVVPSLFVRSRSRNRRSVRTSRAWTELGAFAIVLVIVLLLSVVLTDQLTTLLSGYWAWSIPFFFFLSAIFVGWFFTSTGYRRSGAVESALIVFGILTSVVA